MKSWIKVTDSIYCFRNHESVQKSLRYFENKDIFLHLFIKFQIFELKKNTITIPRNKIDIFEEQIISIDPVDVKMIPPLLASKIIELNLVEESEENLDESVHFFGGWDGFIKEIDNAFLSWLESGQKEDGKNHYLVLPVRLKLNLNLTDMLRFITVISFCAYSDLEKRKEFIHFVLNWYFDIDADKKMIEEAIEGSPQVSCSPELAESFRKMTEPSE
jgi:hypothetical protein